MDRLHAMAAFVAVAERQSFAAAAVALHMSRPAVTRAVASLEDQVGAELLVRTTRRVALSQVGAAYLEDCRRILDAVREADQAASGSFLTPSGRLVVTAPVQFGRLHVLPVLQAFLQAHPEVRADVLLLNRVVQLVDEGVDVGVRIGPLADSAQVAIRVGDVTSVVVASPAYLSAHGQPASPDDLHGHALLAHSHWMQQRAWRFRDQAVRVEPRVQSNDVQSVLDLATGGVGIARLLSYQAAEALADGRLVRILEAQEPPPLPVHLIHAAGRRVPARTRAFLDFARGALRDRLPALQPA